MTTIFGRVALRFGRGLISLAEGKGQVMISEDESES